MNDLQEKARCIFQRYGHPHAFEDALRGKFPDTLRTIPTGDQWVLLSSDQSSKHLSTGKKKSASSKKEKKKISTATADDEEEVVFVGDQTIMLADV